MFHGRSKHIEIRFHLISECFENGDIKVMHVTSKEQEAYIFTKSMANNKFEEMFNLLGVKHISNYGLGGKR